MKKTSLSVFLAIIFMQTAVLLQAQDTSAVDAESLFFRTIRANQNESYMTFGQGIGNVEPLVFEGLVSPYFLLRTSRNARLGATIAPAILIRMFAERSMPVRTPSYMPQVSFYYQLNKNLENKRVQYAYLTLAHHSNGQENSFLNENGSYNTLSGDFATNYFIVGSFFNRKMQNLQSTGEYFHTAMEIHADIGRSKELEGKYSFVRWHNDFRIFRYSSKKQAVKNQNSPKFQTTLKTTWLFGEINQASQFDIEQRLNVSLTFNYMPEVLRDVSLFANLYSGEDYYNMQFFRRITVFRIGIQAYSFK